MEMNFFLHVFAGKIFEQKQFCSINKEMSVFASFYGISMVIHVKKRNKLMRIYLANIKKITVFYRL